MKALSIFGSGLNSLLVLGLCAALPVFAQQRGGMGSRSGTTRQYPSSGSIGDAYFSIDPETRRVVTIADEDTTKYISQVLSNLDKPKPQVLIKVVFLEVTHNNALDIGLEGGWAKPIGGNTKANASDVFGLGALNQAVGSNSPAVNSLGQPVSAFQPTAPIGAPGGAGLYQILGQDYQVTLRAIAQAGSAKVLSRPSILARNNQPATITVGQSVPLIDSVRYDNFGNAINSLRYQDVGVILKVTPFITPDNMVEMIVSPQISSIDQSTQVAISSTASSPVINVRSADTVAVTGDGQTVIIGGLMGKTKAETDTKIPVLGDIPLLGNLFKRKQRSDSNTELLIFLTPHIVMTPSELAALSERERQKANPGKDFSEKDLNRYLDQLPTKDPGAVPNSGSPKDRKRD